MLKFCLWMMAFLLYMIAGAQSRVPAPDAVTLTFVGDIMLGSGVGRVAAKHGVASLYKGVSSYLQADALTIGNLECPVSVRGTAAEKQYTFRAHPALLSGLRQAGVDAVSLGNNHALDFGRDALLDTITALRNAGIAFAGAGENRDAAWTPARLTAGPYTVALVTASRVLPSTSWHAAPSRAGIAPAYDPARLLAETRAARVWADFVVVYLHWGVERATKPQQYQRALARKLIDAGADAVIGSHPHVLQGFEFYNGKPIAYSLGNFVFTNQNNDTAMLRLTCAPGQAPVLKVIPCRIADYRPWVVWKPDVRVKKLAYLEQISYDVRIGVDGTVMPR